MPKKVKSNLKKWKLLEQKTVYECDPWIRLDVQKIKLPDGKIVDNFHQLVLPESVVVYPAISEEKVLMLQSYRHGVGDITMMFPSGSIDEGEIPLDAAKRELLEETGYKTDNWKFLGCFVPHCNYGGGRVHIFKATNVEYVQAAGSSDLEESELKITNISSLGRIVKSGKINSLSSVTAIALGQNQIK